MRLHHFDSDLFAIDPCEDEATNPFCYGKSLAEWLRGAFRKLGYEPEPVIAEDWGWCVMLQRKPFLLWIGCVSDDTALLKTVEPAEVEKGTLIPPALMRWNCMVRAESLIWTAFFWRRLVGLGETASAVARVEQELMAILGSEPRILNLTSEDLGRRTAKS